MVGIKVLFFVGLVAGLAASLLVIGSEDGLKVGLVLGLLEGLVVGGDVGLRVGAKIGRREDLAFLEGFTDGVCVVGAALGLNVAGSWAFTAAGVLVTSNIDASNEVGWNVVGSIVGSNATG